jgi:hypothetical protein
MLSSSSSPYQAPCAAFQRPGPAASDGPAKAVWCACGQAARCVALACRLQVEAYRRPGVEEGARPPQGGGSLGTAPPGQLPETASAADVGDAEDSGGHAEEAGDHAEEAGDHAEEAGDQHPAPQHPAPQAMGMRAAVRLQPVSHNDHLNARQHGKPVRALVVIISRVIISRVMIVARPEGDHPTALENFTLSYVRVAAPS